MNSQLRLMMIEARQTELRTAAADERLARVTRDVGRPLTPNARAQRTGPRTIGGLVRRAGRALSA